MRILYLDLDACRPDHLGCYGYHRNTSPNLDALAQEAMIFMQCHASDAPCLPSRTALYSGRYGINTGVVGHGGTAAQPKVDGPGRDFQDSIGTFGFARRLQLAGLRTAMISPFGQRHAAHWIYAGFNEVQNSGAFGVESAEEIWPSVERWVAQHAAADNWFLHLNFWDIHTPYRVPAGYGEPFAGDPLPQWLQDPEVLKRHQQAVGPHSALEINMYDDAESAKYPRHPGRVTDESSLRRLVDGYDTAVRYVDDYIGRLLQRLRDLGIYEETAIIISADHGENFGELGLYAEHATADAATCRVPLIMKWPGARSGRCDQLVYNIDLPPTLLEMLGQSPPPIWDGVSFGRALWEADFCPTRPELILSQCSHVCQRSVRWDSWLYMRTYHDGFHAFPAEMLFNLVADPQEQVDLAPSHPLVCREGAWRLERWHSAQMQKLAARGGDVVDPLWTVIKEGGPFHARLLSPGNPGSVEAFELYLAHLENTGRRSGAQKLRAQYLG